MTKFPRKNKEFHKLSENIHVYVKDKTDPRTYYLQLSKTFPN